MYSWSMLFLRRSFSVGLPGYLAFLITTGSTDCRVEFSAGLSTGSVILIVNLTENVENYSQTPIKLSKLTSILKLLLVELEVWPISFFPIPSFFPKLWVTWKYPQTYLYLSFCMLYVRKWNEPRPSFNWQLYIHFMIPKI